MKQFVAVASLLGLAAAEPFYGAPLATTYASAIAPSIHAAPAIHTLGYAAPARTVIAAPAVRTIAAPAVRTIAAPAVAAVRTVAPAVAAAPVIAQPAPVTYASTASVKAVPAAVHAQQYHAQDEFGNYQYGYDNPNSQKNEAGNALTGVRGHYVVKDGYGLNRRVDYVADGLGFRATGAGLIKREADAEAFYGSPLATTYASAFAPAIAAPAIRTYAAPAIAAVRTVAPAVAAAPVIAQPAPVTYASTASVKAVPAAVHASQYHAQDEFGNYSYGYANPNSQKKEAGNAYTGVQGSYSYVDSYGLNRRVDYVADGLGFRATPSLG